MKNYIIAWRNLWRNKRRTLITVSSIFFGVILSTIMGSLQEGSYSSMVNNIVKFYSGYIQVHDKEYWEDKTLYYSFKPADSLLNRLSNTEGITVMSPRLESFALISYGEKTQAVMVTGVEPEGENQVTMLSKRIISGTYLAAGDRGILLGEELAVNLNAAVGDTIVLLSQGYYGSNEALRFRVEGILRFPSPEMNKTFCYLDLSMAQEFYSADGMITSLVLMVNDYPEVKQVLKMIRKDLELHYSAMSWDEMQPELVQLINGDRAGGQIMIAILFIIIAFGILGTIIMMIAERKKELAIMVAIGMQKTRLGGILLLETFYIGLIGVLSGLAGSIPVILIMLHNPIQLTGDLAKSMVDMGFEPMMYFSAAPKVFMNQVVIVFAISLGIAIYPLFMTIKLNVIRWMRG